MIPAVPLPPNSGIRIPVDLKMKPGWRFDTSRLTFESETGEEFAPHGDLPKHSRIVYKVPNLANADEAKLSNAERDLRRYLQVILPPGQSPAEYLDVVRAWPCVAEAHSAPNISLPRES